MSEAKRYAVTGASGQLGRLAVASLVERVGAGAVVAMVRDPGKAEGLFAKGVEVRAGDYTQPETLDRAFAGIDGLLFISATDPGVRVGQHRNVVDAAVRQKVARIAYTSILDATNSTLGLAPDHRDTEAMLQESGIPHILLRHGWYTENYTGGIPAALERGSFSGSAGDGRISSATRADYAAGDAAALVDSKPGQKVVYELAGDNAFTMTEFAAEVSKQTGKKIPYVKLSTADHVAALQKAGLPEPVIELITSIDNGTSHGALFNDSGTLSRLIGRPTTDYSEVIAQALKG